MSLGGHYQQEVDLITLFKDVAHEYVHVCMAPQQARQLIDRAIRIAKAERTVTCVIVPNDIQESPWEEPPREHGAMYTSTGYAEPRVLPRDAELRARGRRPERRQEGRDAHRAGREGRDRRGDRGRRRARRGHREGAATAAPSCPTTCRT